MLNYIKPLEPRAIIDSRINLTKETNDIYHTYIGGQKLNYHTLNASTGESSTSGTTTFNKTMPSRSSILDRTIFLKGTQTFEFTGNLVGDDIMPLKQNLFGPKDFPLTNAIRNIEIDFDGTTKTVNIADIFPAAKYYCYTEEEMKTWSTLSPTLLDNNFFFNTGANSNVLAGYSNSGLSFVPSRGQFSVKSYNVRRNNQTGGVQAYFRLSYDFCEPIYISPLNLNASQSFREPGIVGMSNFKIQITWKTPNEIFSSCFCLPIMNDEAYIGNSRFVFNVTPESNATLTFPALLERGTDYNGINVNDWTINSKIENIKCLIGIITLPDTRIVPEVNTYNWIDYDVKKKAYSIGGNPNQPTKERFFSDNFSLSTVPHGILIWASPTTNGRLYSNILGTSSGTPNTAIPVFSLPDIFLPISNVSLDIANQTNVMSNYSPEQLFQINCDNGYKFYNYSNTGMGGNYISSQSFSNDTNLNVLFPRGAPLYLKFGKNIELSDSSISPGTGLNFNVSYNLDVLNMTPNAMDFTVTTIFIYEGVFTIGVEKGSSFATSLLTRQNVIDAATSNVAIDSSALEDDHYLGGTLIAGSFWNKIKRAFKKGTNLVKDIVSNEHVKNILKEALEASKAANVPGVGLVEYAVDKAPEAMRALKGKGLGSSNMYTGGKMLTSSELRRRMK